MPDHLKTLHSLRAFFADGSDERAAIEAAIADMERLDKVERLRLDVDWSEFGQWTAWGLTSRPACASTARAAIDGVTE